MTDLFRVWKSKFWPAVVKECLNCAVSWSECMERVYPAFEDWQLNLNLQMTGQCCGIFMYFIMVLKHLSYSSVGSTLLTFLKTYNSFSKFEK